jgi:hypothetical protein
MRNLSLLYLEMFGDCIRLIDILIESDINEENMRQVFKIKRIILNMLRYDKNYDKNMVLILKDFELSLISILKKDERYTNNIYFYEDKLLSLISRTKIISGYGLNKEETNNYLDGLYNSFEAFYEDDTNNEEQILFQLDTITRDVEIIFFRIFSEIENPVIA